MNAFGYVSICCKLTGLSPKMEGHIPVGALLNNPHLIAQKMISGTTQKETPLTPVKGLSSIGNPWLRLVGLEALVLEGTWETMPETMGIPTSPSVIRGTAIWEGMILSNKEMEPTFSSRGGSQVWESCALQNSAKRGVKRPQGFGWGA